MGFHWGMAVGVHWGIVVGVAHMFVVLLVCFWPHVVFRQEYDVSRFLQLSYDNGETHIERRQ